jgi:hypothetical protein
LARDVEHLAAGRSGHDGRGSEHRLDISAQRDLTHAIEHVRDHARTFFAALASAPRSDGRFRDRPSIREERVRVTDASLADAHEPAADLVGALDGVEATLALLKPPRQTDVPPTMKRRKTSRRSAAVPRLFATNCGS